MKVLHISTSINGGAGISAYRIHKGLLSCEIDSIFISLDCDDNESNKTFRFNTPQKIANYEKPELSFKNYLSEKLHKKFSKKRERINDELLRISNLINPNIFGEFEKFSSPYTLFDLTESEYYKSADIIHLHWVPGYLDFFSFFYKNKKPVIWTFHDMNPILGGYHYEIDNKRNNHNKCIDDYFKRIKCEVLSKLNNLTIVCPSQWLLKKVVDSNIFSPSSKILRCNYHIDSDIYKVLDKKFCKGMFDLPFLKTVFMFVSSDINNFRKGFDFLNDILFDDEFKEVYFLVIGDNKNNIFKKSKNVIYTGTIKDEKLMSIAYNSADFFILPSREDNLPNTMLESLCCGTPVISFDISDSMEIIKKNNLGKVSNEMSSNSLKKTMLECINNSSNFDRGYISNFSKKLFNKSRVVEFYTKLYETKCNR